MEWVKIMCNILDHPKIKMIRKGPEGNTLVLLWLLMLTEAGKSNRGGYLMIADSLPYTAETLSMVTDIPLPTVQLGLRVFTGLDMIERHGNVIGIKNWGKYQSEDKLEARRQRDRVRQQRHRRNEQNNIPAQSSSDEVSRDSHTGMSRDVTLENREEKNREEKTTTTKQARLLLCGTPLVKISDRELQGLASRRALGFSNGAHGLRHSYAQERMEELQCSGMNYEDAKGTVAQEVGHFAKDTTETYLR
ncbi:MAG: phage replisome organizer N-terminal domain-containing protein [Desulfobulbaceae bacterium]|nr:phage replisome organizer N-terminal domain-containing protein [Desulfobulbaceae bacterium]